MTSRTHQGPPTFIAASLIILRSVTQKADCLGPQFTSFDGFSPLLSSPRYFSGKKKKHAHTFIKPVQFLKFLFNLVLLHLGRLGSNKTTVSLTPRICRDAACHPSHRSRRASRDKLGIPHELAVPIYSAAATSRVDPKAGHKTLRFLISKNLGCWKRPKWPTKTTFA